MLPFLESEGWLGSGELPGGWGLEEFFDESDLAAPQLHDEPEEPDEPGLEVHELDNEAPPVVEVLTPT